MEKMRLGVWRCSCQKPGANGKGDSPTASLGASFDDIPLCEVSPNAPVCKLFYLVVNARRATSLSLPSRLDDKHSFPSEDPAQLRR